jgi:hypothetical protein
MKDRRGTDLSVIRITHGNKAAIVVIDSRRHQIPTFDCG